MKKFAFRYEKILQLRIDKEAEIKNKLGKINSLILEKERQLGSIIEQNRSFLKNIEMQMKQGVTAGDLQSIAANKSYLKRTIEKLQSELDVYKDERQVIQAELIEANKQRKVMEKLREKELEQYKELEALEESKVVDQIVTYQSTIARGDNNGGREQ